jgi:hypothetical protein
MSSLIERYYEASSIIKNTDSSTPKSLQPIYKERETRAVAQACHVEQEHLNVSEAIDTKQTIVDIIAMQLMFEIDFTLEDTSCQTKIIEEIKLHLVSVLKNEYSNKQHKQDIKKFTVLAIKILRIKSLLDLKKILRTNPEVKSYINLNLQDYSDISKELFERIT